MQAKTQQLEPDMEQWTGSELGKEYVKAVYCHPAYLIYMHSTLCEMSGWIKHKLESRLLGEISEVIDISPCNLDSSLCFIQLSISHAVLCIEVK